MSQPENQQSTIVRKSKSRSSQDEHKWRKLQVAYITISSILILATFFSILLFNNRETCETETKQSLNDIVQSRPGSLHSYCGTASERGEGISQGITISLMVILCVGYILLPKLNDYLNPPKDHAIN